MTTFVERLRRAAKAAGVGESQSEIADYLGLSKQTVNRWFKGGEPNAEMTFDIARRLRVLPEWLRTGSGEMQPAPGDGLTQDERELITHYRSATPKVREVIGTMARAVRKAAVAVALVIPPLMALHPAEASFDITFSSIHIAFRRWMKTVLASKCALAIAIA